MFKFEKIKAYINNLMKLEASDPDIQKFLELHSEFDQSLQVIYIGLYRGAIEEKNVFTPGYRSWLNHVYDNYIKNKEIVNWLFKYSDYDYKSMNSRDRIKLSSIRNRFQRNGLFITLRDAEVVKRIYEAAGKPKKKSSKLNKDIKEIKIRLEIQTISIEDYFEKNKQYKKYFLLFYKMRRNFWIIAFSRYIRITNKNLTPRQLVVLDSFLSTFNEKQRHDLEIISKLRLNKSDRWLVGNIRYSLDCFPFLHEYYENRLDKLKSRYLAQYLMKD